jgi:cell wall-associated NlpC family hydrolase
MTKVEIANKVAWSMYGKPYLWGGDNPVAGFDCSGFCIEILKSVGILPRKGDWTAQGLWDRLEGKRTVPHPFAGCLVFWTNKSGDRIIHAEYAITPKLCMGASGGGSRTTDESKAIEQDAYIKVRPWNTRDNVKGFINPFVFE